MPKFRVMTEQAIYVPHFKVFEAATMEEAEIAAEAEVEGMVQGQTLTDFGGWIEGDRTTEYTVMLDVTEELNDDGSRRGD